MAHRRAPGEGQVNWNNTHNVYVAVLVVGKHPVTGRDITRNRYASLKGKTRAAYKDAEDKLQQLKDELTVVAEEEARAADPTNYTLWRAIEDWHEWVPTTVKTSQKTADKYFDQCRKWVKPRLGDVPLHEVTIKKLSDMLEEIAPVLSADSLQDILGTVRRALAYAMREETRTGFAGPNPATDVVLPQAGVTPRAWDFLTQAEVEVVLTSVKGTRMEALMMAGFMCGMRPGELRALQWEDIDFRQQVLYVVKYIKPGAPASRRGIPLPARLVTALQEHQERYKDGIHVFTREDGRQLDKDGLSWRVGKVFRDTGFPHLQDAYVMRHTFASIMDDKGVKHQTIADWMGHKNVTTFQRIYRHRLRPVVAQVEDIW